MPDFGCNVTVVNRCSDVLTLTFNLVGSGEWNVPPPDQIQAGETKSFSVSNKPGPLGSEGWARYGLKGTTASVKLYFSCPVWGVNQFYLTSTNYQVISTSQDGPSRGHPMYVTAYCDKAKFHLDENIAFEEGVVGSEIEAHPVIQEWNATDKPSPDLIERYEAYLTELKGRMVDTAKPNPSST